MKLLVPLQLVAASILVLAASGPVRAESDEYAAPVYGISAVDSYDQRIEQLEAQLASLREQMGGGDSAGGCGQPCAPTCGTCCGKRGCGWVFEAEALLLAYHRADGMRVGVGADEYVNSSFNLAPRLTLGYAGPEGTGIRLRWFDYNHSEETGRDLDGEFLSVDTFNLDLELYDEVCLGQNWTLELSGGYRYNNFDEVMADVDGNVQEIRRNFSNSQGGIIGVEARRHFWWGTLYGGLRGSILLGDHTVIDQADGAVRLGDVVQSIWEIGVGYEQTWDLCYGTVFVRLGGEWQQWQNFSSEFDTGVFESDFDGTGDVGFGGFRFSMGVIR